MGVVIGLQGMLPGLATAHFLAADNNMNIIMHIDPLDDPVPGQTSTLAFEFTDSTNRFQLADCQCTLAIRSQQSTTYRTTLMPGRSEQPSIFSDSVLYTFPTHSVYYVTVSGRPKTAGAFRPFSVTWGVQVSQSPKAGFRTLPVFVLFFAGLLVAFALMILGVIGLDKLPALWKARAERRQR